MHELDERASTEIKGLRPIQVHTDRIMRRVGDEVAGRPSGESMEPLVNGKQQRLPNLLDGSAIAKEDAGVEFEKTFLERTKVGVAHLTEGRDWFGVRRRAGIADAGRC